MLLTHKNKLDKYLPFWHVDGSVDDFLDSFDVTELILSTSQNKPSFEIKLHWGIDSSQSNAPQFSSLLQRKEHCIMVLKNNSNQTNS